MMAKMTIELNVRASDKWASAKAVDGTKWYHGKPTNPNWTAINATLRTMKPEVHELDKRNERHKQLLDFYPSCFGNAREEWEMTCTAAAFATGVHGRLSNEHSDIISSFKMTVSNSGFEPAKQFKTIDSFVEAINAIPEPKNDEDAEAETAKPGALAELRQQLETQQAAMEAMQTQMFLMEARIEELEK